MRSALYSCIILVLSQFMTPTFSAIFCNFLNTSTWMINGFSGLCNNILYHAR